MPVLTHIKVSGVVIVKELESPHQLALLRLAGGDVHGQEELLEVEKIVAVAVEDAHDVPAELVGVACNNEVQSGDVTIA